MSETSKKYLKRVKQKIAEAKEKRLKELDLEGEIGEEQKQLTRLPEELFDSLGDGGCKYINR